MNHVFDRAWWLTHFIIELCTRDWKYSLVLGLLYIQDGLFVWIPLCHNRSPYVAQAGIKLSVFSLVWANIKGEATRERKGLFCLLVPGLQSIMVGKAQSRGEGSRRCCICPQREVSVGSARSFSFYSDGDPGMMLPTVRGHPTSINTIWQPLTDVPRCLSSRWF